MSNIIYRKDHSSSANNGERWNPRDIIDFQNDVASTVNGGLTDSNFNSSAAIAESKIFFDVVAGHTHDGSNSRTISSANTTVVNDSNLRSGMRITIIDNDNIQIGPGYVTIGNESFLKTSVNTTLKVEAANFVNGVEPSDDYFYVYIFNNGTASNPDPQFRFSDESPDLGNISAGTAERPLRYQVYGSVNYRCIGAVRNDGDSNLIDGLETSFDMSNFWTGFTPSTTSSDFTVETIWTPTFVMAFNDIVSTNTFMNVITTTPRFLTNSLVGVGDGGNTPLYSSQTSTSEAGAAKTLTAQTTSVPGSFTVDAPANGDIVYYWAWHLGTRGA